MTACLRLTDRMPAVAHGRSAWTALEEAHLASCAECRQEWRLVLGAAGLGARIEEEFDADAVARRVLLRLRNTGGPSVSRPRPAVVRWAVTLAAAAALALALGVGRLQSPRSLTSGPEIALLAELDDLSAGELEVVLDGLPPAPALSTPTGVGLGDLTEDELERLLRSLEG